MNLRHFVIEQKETNDKTLSRAALTFNESNRVSHMARRAWFDGRVRLYLIKRERRDCVRG
jgi:hypothetical protein